MRSLPLGGSRLDLLNRRRDRYARRLERLATRPLHVASQQEPLPVLLHLHGLQPIQVGDHIRPRELVPPRLQPRLEFLTQHQRQERTEYMTPDRLVTAVVDRTRL